MTTFELWTPSDAAGVIAVPGEDDDKYSRGVLGILTGSTQYPGAAVLGCEAAIHTGVGMVRYVGPELPGGLVLARRPEVVTSNGRVQAWLIGSGMAAFDTLGRDNESSAAIADAIAQPVPVVLDGGAFDLVGHTAGPAVLTPHYRELARVLGTSADDIASDPAGAAERAAAELGATVLLKGHTTWIVSADGTRLRVVSPTTWLATAGSGDALAGILGALVATHADEVVADGSTLARLAATAAVIHGLAGERASAGGPLAVLDLATAVAPTIGALLAGIP